MAELARDWSELLVAAGLDPQDVEVKVVRHQPRGGASVVASHPGRGLSCEASAYGTTEENAAEAIAGLLDLLSGGAY